MSQEQNNGGKNTDDEDLSKVKGIAALAYLIFFVPLIACPDSKFARYHSNQGLLLLITWIIVAVIINILSFIPIIGLLIYAAGVIFILVLLVKGIVSAINGRMEPLPVIGNAAVIIK